MAGRGTGIGAGNTKGGAAVALANQAAIRTPTIKASHPKRIAAVERSEVLRGIAL
ncbi:MAG TPA: hypothetical protein VF637_18790 [Sphingomicrobium sp.]|jgi:hypothetical protein